MCPTYICMSDICEVNPRGPFLVRPDSITPAMGPFRRATRGPPQAPQSRDDNPVEQSLPHC